MIYIHFYCQGYENSKGLAIIQDFTAHSAIKNEQMANVWALDAQMPRCRRFYEETSSLIKLLS
jgi:hypothetical protein